MATIITQMPWANFDNLAMAALTITEEDIDTMLGTAYGAWHGDRRAKEWIPSQ